MYLYSAISTKDAYAIVVLGEKDVKLCTSHFLCTGIKYLTLAGSKKSDLFGACSEGSVSVWKTTRQKGHGERIWRRKAVLYILGRNKTKKVRGREAGREREEEREILQRHTLRNPPPPTSLFLLVTHLTTNAGIN